MNFMYVAKVVLYSKNYFCCCHSTILCELYHFNCVVLQLPAQICFCCSYKRTCQKTGDWSWQTTIYACNQDLTGSWLFCMWNFPCSINYWNQSKLPVTKTFDLHVTVSIIKKEQIANRKIFYIIHFGLPFWNFWL